MQQQIIKLNELTLAGLTIRTNNEDEMKLKEAKIGGLVSRYWSEQINKQIQHRTNPGITYAVYCEFDQQDQGNYTYLIGEEVMPGSNQQNDLFKTIIIEASRYQKMTSKSGPIPDIVIQSWQQIWKMTEFAGKRTFKADFEVYDHRASDPSKAVIDIFIGIT